MAQHLRIANADFRPRRPGDFAHTETAQDILHTLELMLHREEPSVVMIAGAPGVGKTKAVEYFAGDRRNRAMIWSIANGEGKPSGVAYSLLRAFGTEGNGMSLSAMRELLARYIGGRVVILDDAHNLQAQGADWARSLAEYGGFDLVLCGGLELQHQVNLNSSLRSRIHASRPIVIKQVSRADVACLVEGTPFATDAAIKLLQAVAPIFDGGLRNVAAVMEQASIFAGDTCPTAGHIASAIHHLNLAPMGGK